LKKLSPVEIAFLLFITTFVIILKVPVTSLPYTEDGATWTINSALWIYDNYFVYPIIENTTRGISGGNGHPTLIFNLLAVLYHIFGYSIELTHITMIIFGCLTLLYTYLLATFIYNKSVGVISSILLIVTPLYFSLIGQLRLDVPLMAFSVMTLYYAAIEKRWAFAITGSLLVLTKEPGTAVVFCCFLYIALKYFKKESVSAYIKRLFTYCIPALVFLSWVILYHHYIGTFFYKNVAFTAEVPILRYQQVFVWNFRCFLSIVMIIALVLNNFKTGIYPRRLKSAIIIVIISFIIYYYGEPVENLRIISNITFSLLTGLVLTIDFKKIDIKHILIPVTLFIYISLHGFIFDLQPRYMLPMISFYIIVASSGINMLSQYWKHAAIYLTIIVIAFSIYHINHSRYKWTNMSYTELIDIRFEMISYVGDRYKDYIIGLDSYIVPIMLTEPRVGYVKTKLPCVGLRNIKPNPPGTIQEYDIILFSN